MEAEYLKIPGDRVGVLIGKGGETKKLVEKKAGVDLDITHEGSVTIKCEDGLKLWTGRDIVKAIGRGFNPKYALNLSKEGYALTIFNLDEIFHGRESDIRRVKSRIIGEDGKARRTMETLSDSKISVYGKTVSVIAREEDMDAIEEALKMLMDGAHHAKVYTFLEGAHKEKKPGL